MNTINAIETKYNGYRFRSRLEARWAVFFDALAIPYQYEKDGFRVKNQCYLADFWLPTTVVHLSNAQFIQAYIEVKPTLTEIKSYTNIIKGIEASNKVLIAADGWMNLYYFNGLNPPVPLFLYGCRSDGTIHLADATSASSVNCCIHTVRYSTAGMPQSVQRLYNLHVSQQRERCFFEYPQERARELAKSARFEHGETPTPYQLRIDSGISKILSSQTLIPHFKFSPGQHVYNRKTSQAAWVEYCDNNELIVHDGAAEFIASINDYTDDYDETEQANRFEEMEFENDFLEEVKYSESARKTLDKKYAPKVISVLDYFYMSFIAKSSGLSASTIRKLRDGVYENPELAKDRAEKARPIFKVGNRVTHSKWGAGTVIKIDQHRDNHQTCLVLFDNQNLEWLISMFLDLETPNDRTETT